MRKNHAKRYSYKTRFVEFFYPDFATQRKSAWLIILRKPICEREFWKKNITRIFFSSYFFHVLSRKFSLKLVYQFLQSVKYVKKGLLKTVLHIFQKFSSIGFLYQTLVLAFLKIKKGNQQKHFFQICERKVQK